MNHRRTELRIAALPIGDSAAIGETCVQSEILSRIDSAQSLHNSPTRLRTSSLSIYSQNSHRSPRSTSGAPSATTLSSRP